MGLPRLVSTMGSLRRGERPPGFADHHGPRRRPAGVALWPVVRAPGRQDHLRHGRDARHGPPRRTRRTAHALRVRLLSRPSCAAVTSDVTWGVEGIIFSAGIVRRMARESSGSSPTSPTAKRCARSVSSHRRRVLRPGLLWPRHAAVGLRRARCLLRSHARARREPISCARYLKASPSAAPTCSTRPKREIGVDSGSCASTAE